MKVKWCDIAPLLKKYGGAVKSPYYVVVEDITDVDLIPCVDFETAKFIVGSLGERYFQHAKFEIIEVI